ncbi:hypothetical protein EUX98_g8920, partial [Antrodiella citrinella]
PGVMAQELVPIPEAPEPVDVPDFSPDEYATTVTQVEGEDNQYYVSCPYDTYLSGLPPGAVPKPLKTGGGSHHLRCIRSKVNNREEVDCILDGGSQIISMSEATCHALSLPYDPATRMSMQSANGTMDTSLGLCRNIPFSIGHIIVYLQVHNYTNEEQTITITCPNSGIKTTLPTFPRTRPKFSMPMPFGELIDDLGEHAYVLEHDSESESLAVLAYTPRPISRTQLISLYLSQCTSAYIEQDISDSIQTQHLLDIDPSPPPSPVSPFASTFFAVASQPSVPADLLQSSPFPSRSEIHRPGYAVSVSDAPPTRQSYISAKKKYKPVHLKVDPVRATLPSEFRIERNIIGDPLATMPALPTRPPKFVPTGRYTAERQVAFRKNHDTGFLFPAELDLVDWLVCQHEKGFAWSDSERGKFKPEYFPPIKLPVLPHTPWVEKNIPIPPGLYEEVCGIIWKKIAAGVYEPSNSSYRSRWFCVLKKDGKSLRLVHSLEPLNKVTIQHVGVTPIPDQLAERFGGRPCLGTLDLYVGYDERELHPDSRDLTTFQTPHGAQRLTTLPMGWSNSVPIFHDDVSFILREEIPEYAGVYIDDVGIIGPATDYPLPDSCFETIPENRDIRRFVFEHLQNVNRILQRLKYAGATCSGTKSFLIIREGMVLGHRCTPNGREPEPSRVDAIYNWGPCRNVSEARAFLGTAGILRNFVSNFGKIAAPITKLTRKDAVFEWSTAQIEAQRTLKEAILASPALRAIDYNSPCPVILAVDVT